MNDKPQKHNSRLDDSMRRLYGGDDYYGWSSSQTGFWAGFIGYFALIAGLFYLIAMYYLDQEK
jgi:hypothetical protein